MPDLDAPTAASADRLPTVRDWAAAEAGLGRPLAGAAAALARLDERVAHRPGAAARIATLEVAALSWSDGAPLGVDRIALYRLARQGPADRAADLSRADWALRRLTAGQGGPGPLDDLGAFLGLVDGAVREAAEIEAHARRLRDALDPALHPLTRAGLVFETWRAIGLTAPGRLLEPAAAAARLAAGECRALPFAPVALGGRLTVGGGGPAARLGRWLDRIGAAAVAGLAELDRIGRWQERARRVIAPRSGRIPPALVAALAESPELTAEAAAAATGASAAAIRRNMADLERQGLVRELTGQGRFRVWTIA